MVNFLNDWHDVAELAREVLDTEFDQTKVEQEMKSAYSKIGSATGKWDWGVTPVNDPRVPNITKIEQQLAAAYILEYYGSKTPDELAAIQSLRDAAKESLVEVVATSSDLGLNIDESLLVITSIFESYPASLIDDPNAIPYRSTNVSI